MKASTFNKTTLLLAFLLGLVGTTLSAATPFGKKEFTKKIEEIYDISADGTVDLNNRYGEVDVKTWDKNKVEVQVTIIVNSGDEESAQETFDRIKIDLSNNRSEVKVETTIESKSSSSSWWSSWGGSSNSNDDYKINYLIHMPASNDLRLANKYGHSFVEMLNGNAHTTIKYGDITMEDVAGKLNMDIGYGNATVGNTGDAAVVIKYGKFKLKSGKDINITSKYSKIYIDKAAEVRSETKYDHYNIGDIHELRNAGKYDHFDIESLENIDIETKYTDLNIENLEQSASISMSYGGTRIEKLAAGFSSLDLEGRYTDFKISPASGAAYQLDATARYGKIRYPSEMDLRREIDKSNTHEVEGSVGGSGGVIKANLDYGSLRIY